MTFKQFFVKLPKFVRASIKNPYVFYEKIVELHAVSRFMPDRLFYEITYRGFTGLKLDVDNPKSFNEKTNWLMLYDRKDWYWKLSDKYEARQYIADRVGDKYLIPVYGIFSSVDEIDFDKLPDQFVLKTTHDSGTIVLCEDKANLDIPKARKYLRKRLKRNYFWEHHEFPYKVIKPRIICEKFITPDGTSTPIDYKFFCFHGEPKLIQVDTDRYIDHGRLTLWPDWTKAPFDIDRTYVKPNLWVEKPANLEEMLELSRILSKEFAFLRVDFYSVNGKVYMGELTFYQRAGIDPIHPHEYNYLMGSWLDPSKV